MDTIQLALLVMTGLALMAMLYVNYANPLSDKASARRLQALRERHGENTEEKVAAQIRKAVAARRPTNHLAGSGSQIEALALRLHRTGKGWSMQSYLYVSLGLGGTIALLVWLKSGVLLLALLVGIAVGAGIPHMVVGFLINKRYNAFTAKFPDAIELLVRGLRSGLPVAETLGVVAKELPGPVSEEFKLVTERIRIGRSMEDALVETADRLNMPEFNFFCITLAIQRETGGNLAETLENLSKVLRQRAQMKLKIKAMSSESKASAYIVGSLPFLVFAMIFYVNPNYLGGFFVDQRLIVAGLGGLCWMGIGVFIMSKMVSFEI
jgi:tight adherence protein B